MKKKDLLGQLTNLKSNFILGMAAISLFSNEEVYRILDESNVVFGPFSIEFKQVSTLLKNEDDKKLAMKEFILSIIRSLIKESFEVIQYYCEETNQLNTFKSESWYQFARIIRNCLSHNFKLEFNKYDLSILPAKWWERTITRSMNGSYLSLDFFGYIESWALFKDVNDFANKLI